MMITGCSFSVIDEKSTENAAGSSAENASESSAENATGSSTEIADRNVEFAYEYGVFLGAEPEDVEGMKQYETIVVEGQLFTREEVEALQQEGHKVFSYINVGAIENYREYYKDYEKFTLDVYENWEDEKWIDVTEQEWQSFVTDDLAGELKDKGFDGLFVDNLDVYYHYPSDESFDAITSILKAFKDYGFYVSINGGDVYVQKCLDTFESVDDLFDAVNQETVFSSIIWDEEDTFGSQDASETENFTEYLDEVAKQGIDVYLLEYTTDEKLIDDIKKFCGEKGYYYYISPKLNLEVD